MKKNDIMSSMNELFQETFDLIWIRKKVGDQKQKAAATGGFGESAEVFGKCGGFLGGLVDGLGKREEVGGLAFGGKVVLLFAVKGEESDGIALTEQKVSDREGEGGGVVVFGGSLFAIFGVLGVVHGGRSIEQDVAA